MNCFEQNNFDRNVHTPQNDQRDVVIILKKKCSGTLYPPHPPPPRASGHHNPVGVYICNRWPPIIVAFCWALQHCSIKWTIAQEAFWGGGVGQGRRAATKWVREYLNMQRVLAVSVHIPNCTTIAATVQVHTRLSNSTPLSCTVVHGLHDKHKPGAQWQGSEVPSLGTFSGTLSGKWAKVGKMGENGGK